MIFNEFVLTSKSFIRTVTTVNPDWYVLIFQTGIQTTNSLWRSRLLENGGDYFNLKTFPEGEAKTALERVWNRKMGKRFNEESGPVEKPKKQKKKKLATEPTSGVAERFEPVSGKKLAPEPTSGPAERFEPVSGPSTNY